MLEQALKPGIRSSRRGDLRDENLSVHRCSSPRSGQGRTRPSWYIEPERFLGVPLYDQRTHRRCRGGSSPFVGEGRTLPWYVTTQFGGGRPTPSPCAYHSVARAEAKGWRLSSGLLQVAGLNTVPSAKVGFVN
jgi:hypothetical protein